MLLWSSTNVVGFLLHVPIFPKRQNCPWTSCFSWYPRKWLDKKSRKFKAKAWKWLAIDLRYFFCWEQHFWFPVLNFTDISWDFLHQSRLTQTILDHERKDWMPHFANSIFVIPKKGSKLANPILPNTFWEGIWTPKHLLRRLLGAPNTFSPDIWRILDV